MNIQLKSTNIQLIVGGYVLARKNRTFPNELDSIKLNLYLCSGQAVCNVKYFTHLGGRIVLELVETQNFGISCCP